MAEPEDVRRANDRPTSHVLHEKLASWFATEARDLPWRRDPSPWRVLVSEFMLQQTQVSRVLPVFEHWLHRWPVPAALAEDSPGEAVRMWGRLGYPRRALRLHGAAVIIDRDFGGQVPDNHADLLSLPGIGEYTAAAIASFAFGQRHIVLDTNVRRVFARVIEGEQYPAPNVTVGEREIARSLLPERDAASWAAATMELGAVVCTAKAPRCTACPIVAECQWRLAGYPAWDGPRRASQKYDGTDRQCRGRLLALVRDSDEPIPKSALDAVWPDVQQRERALFSLLEDGLLLLTRDEKHVTLP